MRHLAVAPHHQTTGNHTTSAFGYDRVGTASLRYTRRSQVVAPTRRVGWIVSLVVALGALAQPEVRKGMALEALRAAFAGTFVFGGALFAICSVPMAAVYVAGWVLYGVARHVDGRLNEGTRRQQVIALAEAA